MKRLFAISTLIPVIFLSGCSQIPSYQTPTTELPNNNDWQAQQSLVSMRLDLDEKAWLQQLSGDQQLFALINEALTHNKDIQLAKLNLQQARLLLEQATANQYPELSVNSDLSRTQTSDQAYPVNTQTTYGNFSLGTLLSYELDIWGRVDALKQQAQASLKASQAEQKTIQLSVSAAVSQAYLNLMALNQRVYLAQNTVKSRQEALQLRQTQLEYGAVTPLSVYQAQSELASVEIALQQQIEQRDLQLHALAVLLGRSPKALTKIDTSTFNTQPLKMVNTLPVPQNLPSKLLERRPDILAMEQRLIAANANIGVAKAALFPSISLTGLLGFQSESLKDLFADGSIAWNTSATISAPIFDYGKRQSQVQLSKTQKEALVIQYQHTLRTAFKEVLDALTTLNGSRQQLQAQQRQVSALSTVLDLAQKRFDAGYSSYLEVLDAQRNLFNAQLAQVTMKLNHSIALVDLYKALGGNWQSNQQTQNNGAL
ncbi:MAG: efflux transporter outer membrane subunit [Thiomicrorhabdus sp.]|nr:efflux transporter outer membrane subunit [Thiomicrorhabdus sp.]